MLNKTHLGDGMVALTGTGFNGCIEMQYMPAWNKKQSNSPNPTQRFGCHSRPVLPDQSLISCWRGSVNEGAVAGGGLLLEEGCDWRSVVSCLAWSAAKSPQLAGGFHCPGRNLLKTNVFAEVLRDG